LLQDELEVRILLKMAAVLSHRSHF